MLTQIRHYLILNWPLLALVGVSIVSTSIGVVVGVLVLLWWV